MYKDIYVSNIIHTSNLDELDTHVDIHITFNDAKEYIQLVELDWINMQRGFKEDWTDKEFNEWLKEALVTSIYEDGVCMYKSYIYDDDGDEKVFSITNHKIKI